MEFVWTATLLAVVIIIMQIIILANQGKNGKLIRELIAQRSRQSQPDRDRFRDRKDNNFRQNRHSQQNQQEFRSRPQQGHSAPASAGAVDNVEKSLRDINLKLKNAERDQEAARRKIQDNTGNNNQQQRRRHHNDGGRGGRDGGRDNRRGNDRGGDRNNRNNWQNRNNQERTRNETDRRSDEVLPEEPRNIMPPISEQVSIPAEPTLPDLKPMDFDVDATEHGRKVNVRRHPSTDNDTPEISESANSSSPETFSTEAADSESQGPVSVDGEGAGQPTDSEISFGRR